MSHLNSKMQHKRHRPILPMSAKFILLKLSGKSPTLVSQLYSSATKKTAILSTNAGYILLVTGYVSKGYPDKGEC